MPERSARFALPFLIPGQAQKEIFHNEAIAGIDAALHACVEEGPIGVPPAAPAEGQSWIAAVGATGAWAGNDNALATWTSGGWRYTDPVAGMMAWNKIAGFWHHWDGSVWSAGELPAASLKIDGQQIVGPRLPEVPSPSGGTTIDAEARAAIDAIIATLKSHGLTN